MSVELRKITEDNFRQVMEMKVAEEQSKFVATNMLSLAQAWLEYDTTRPYAIYAADEPVGFLMFSWDVPKKECHLWRFMVNARFQGKGYGKEALIKALEMAGEEPAFSSVELSYVPGNETAEGLYRDLGFAPTGEVEDGEIVMKLDLKR